MCIPTNVPDVAVPRQRQEARAPDAGAVKSTKGRRVTDAMKSATPTILTSTFGTQSGQTDKKTLLGA